MSEQQIPTETEALDLLGLGNPETNLLYSLIVQPQNLDLVAGMVTVEDFHDTERAWIFEQMLAARRDAKPPLTAEDLIRLTKSEGRHSARVVLVDCLRDAWERGINSEAYALDLLERNKRQEAAAALQDATDALEHGSSDAILAELRGKLEQLEQGGSRSGTRIDEAAENALADMQDTDRRTGAIPTGIAVWDQRTGGVLPAELVVIAARPGVGKTALGLELAESFSQRGAVAFFSFEMLESEIVNRFILRHSPEGSIDLRASNFTRSDVDRARVALQRISSRPLYLYDDPSLSINDLTARADALDKTQPLSAVVVDYLQLISPGKTDGRSTRAEQVSQMSRELKRLAMQLKIPVIALSQVNREAVKDGKIKLHHLRESGSIEQDASVVVFLQETAGELSSLDLAKNRNGQTFEFPYVFRKATQTFVDPGGIVAPTPDPVLEKFNSGEF